MIIAGNDITTNTGFMAILTSASTSPAITTVDSVSPTPSLSGPKIAAAIHNPRDETIQRKSKPVNNRCIPVIIVANEPLKFAMLPSYMDLRLSYNFFARLGPTTSLSSSSEAKPTAFAEPNVLISFFLVNGPTPGTRSSKLLV